jgi:hypothetical protein
MSIISQLWNQRYHIIAGVRPLLKAVLVEVGLRLMGSPRTGPLVTQLVQHGVTALVRWKGLADA